MRSQHYESELKGFRFLNENAYEKLHKTWSDFWPQTGNPPNWDAVGWLGDNRYPEKPSELLLIEAKAHIGELKSNCNAGKSSIKRIQNALDIVKNDIGIKSSGDWLKDYYQYANRIGRKISIDGAAYNDSDKPFHIACLQNGCRGLICLLDSGFATHQMEPMTGLSPI